MRPPPQTLITSKVQGVAQSQGAANHCHEEEEKKDKNERVQSKQTDGRKAHRPALTSPNGMVTILKGLEKTNTRKKRARQYST